MNDSASAVPSSLRVLVLLFYPSLVICSYNLGNLLELYSFNNTSMYKYTSVVFFPVTIEQEPTRAIAASY